jgi:aspartyl-tRNA(Asn)/glutamyl-tRNA(Gln) amidotransferase subunit C
MELSSNEIKDIAHLGRIGVSDEEVAMYQKDLSSVLKYFEKLQEVDTENVEEIGHITGMTDVYRIDRVEEMDDAGKQGIMANVRETQDGYIKVKSIL